MPGPIQRGRAFVERILSNGVETVDAEKGRISGDEKIQIGVPSDSPTVYDALISAGKILRNAEIGVEITIASSHEIEAPCHFSGVSMRSVSITSENDSVITVSNSFPESDDLFLFNNSVAPVLDLSIDAQNNCSNGITASNSIVDVTENGGIDNVNNRGIRASAGSSVFAQDTHFTDCGDRGVMVTTCSRADLRDADLSGAGVYGLFVSRGSQCHANRITANDCADEGDRGAVEIRRSIVSVESADVLNSGSEGIRADSCSNVSAGSADVSGASSIGFRVRRGSTLRANNATADNCGGNAVSVVGASSFDGEEMRAEDASSSAISVSSGSIANLSGAEIINPNSYGVLVSSGAKVNASSALIEDADNPGLYANTGYIAAQSVEINGSPDEAVRCFRGSLMGLNSVSVDGESLTAEDTTIDNLNEVTSDGIIFN